MIGRVRLILIDRHYGFINDDKGNEYFLHVTEFKGDWEELVGLYERNLSPTVEFIPLKTPKGFRATDIHLLD